MSQSWPAPAGSGASLPSYGAEAKLSQPLPAPAGARAPPPVRPEAKLSQRLPAPAIPPSTIGVHGRVFPQQVWRRGELPCLRPEPSRARNEGLPDGACEPDFVKGMLKELHGELVDIEPPSDSGTCRSMHGYVTRASFGRCSRWWCLCQRLQCWQGGQRVAACSGVADDEAGSC